jgi:hypothetical protein
MSRLLFIWWGFTWINLQKGELKQIKHVAKIKIVPQKMDENGDIVGYWFSQDFNQLRKYDPIYFDVRI